MTQLGITRIDSLILSFLSSSGSKLDLEQIAASWSYAEEFVKCDKVTHLGISDLDTTQLKQFYEMPHHVKPSVNQINLDACCVIPPEMSNYAKENNIQLLTHNDPRGKQLKDYVRLNALTMIIISSNRYF